ncbi:hypothetical protein QCA50_009792 [Cerrena zonata]|uniref:Transfer RNA methyltransferase 82 n=1 Tax=Cerrena zonata TaxID=2478898 RepID=A0AAW0G6Z8_9APHY
MFNLPHTGLYIGQTRTIAISGPHIQVIDSKTGNIVHSTSEQEQSQKDSILKSGPIRCFTVDNTFSTLVTSGEDKKLKVWQIDGLKLLSERELPKKPTDIRLVQDSQTILVSDKFGDIFSYPLTPDNSTPSSSQAPPAGTSKRGSLTSHENPSNGTLVLGHTSLLTSFVLTEDEKFIISADRDEHIRISWNPQGHVIERYCLGHKKFVSAITVPRFEPSILISGGGDPELKLWDWLSGRHLGDIPVLSVVEPYIKAKAPPGHRGWYDHADAGDEAPGRRRGKGRKGKGKGKAPSETPQAEQDSKNESANVKRDVIMEEVSGEPKVEGEEKQAGPSQTPDEPVFVLHKIETVDLNDDGRFIVFSAVGASALFYTAFPANPKLAFASNEVYVLEFDKPVIDFVVAEGNKLYVLLDFNFQVQSTIETESPTQTCAVKLVSWKNGRLSLDEAKPPLLVALNSNALIAVTEGDLKALDLYAHLASMPKQVDPEHDPMIREELPSAPPEDDPEKRLTQRELGRLKNKKALLAKISKREGTSQTPEGEKAEGEDTSEERETKKKKADEDVSMKNEDA